MEVAAQAALDGAKARQILDGARATFMELGFEGASVDEIARRARVSKPTVYSHFGDKRGVFAAFVQRACQEHALQIFDQVDEAAGTEAALRRIARHFAAFLVTPCARDLFRLVVAEAARFPELGQLFYEAGPAQGKRRVTRLLGVAVERGELAIEDVDLAAHQFMELCKATLFFRRLLLVGDEPTEAEIERVADGAVTLFLRAFEPRPSPPGRHGHRHDDTPVEPDRRTAREPERMEAAATAD